MRASVNTELFSRNFSAVLPPIQLSYMLNCKAHSPYFHITVGSGARFGDVLGRTQLQQGLCLRFFLPVQKGVKVMAAIYPRGARLEGSHFVQAGAFRRNGSDPLAPSSFLETNSTNSPKLTQTSMSPSRQILVSLQAEDFSLTTAIFYEPDSLSSLKSSPSFPVVFCNQGDQGKASKSLSK